MKESTETYKASGVNPEDIMMEEEREEDPVEETYEESDEEGGPEEDPEEETYEGSDEAQGDVIHEVPEEELMHKEIDLEMEEDPELEIVEESEEDPEEEINGESGEEGLAEENADLSSAMSGGINSKDMGNEPYENQEEKRGNKVAEGSSGKCRKSRWDLKQEGETPEIDGNGKRRKTRWNNNDSQNGLTNPSGFIDPLKLLTDPKIIQLKAKLMKVNEKLQSWEIRDERPPGERSPSPEPVYNNLGLRMNTRDARMRQVLINKKNRIICRLAKSSLAFQSPSKLVKKVFVPEKEYPSYNFIGLILGPKGNTQKKMENETGAKILLRGKGSGDTKSQDEGLHVRVEAHNRQSLDAAVVMVKKLLVPVADQCNDHKRAQLAELAKLRGTYKDSNICDLCKEHGHRRYACPLQESTFKGVCCDLCGSLGHLAPSCNVSKDKSNKEVDLANLYVGYLPRVIDDKRLRELFSPFGKIIKTGVIKDQTSGVSKGYGFVKFENALDADAAIKYMNGHKMDGKMLAVRVAGQRPTVGSSHPGHVLPVPYNILGQSCNYGSATTMFPEAPYSTVNSESLSFALSTGHSIGVARTQTDPRLSSYLSSGYDFSVQNPTSSQFPGDPDYVGSQFNSYFAGTAVNAAQNGMPETAKSSSFLSDSYFPSL